MDSSSGQDTVCIMGDKTSSTTIHSDRKFCGNFFKCKQQVLDGVAYNFSAVEARGACKFCFPFYAYVKTGKGDLS